jgi:hypothetical protein
MTTSIEEEEERGGVGSFLQPKNKLVFVPVPVAGEETVEDERERERERAVDDGLDVDDNDTVDYALDVDVTGEETVEDTDVDVDNATVDDTSNVDDVFFFD